MLPFVPFQQTNYLILAQFAGQYLMDDSDFLVAVVLITFVLFKIEQDLVFSVKLHFKKKLVKEGVFSPKCFGITTYGLLVPAFFLVEGG